eukprot:COSAG03_NODE_1838_length_3452_cov_89.093051_2_plen_71_part_00
MCLPPRSPSTPLPSEADGGGPACRHAHLRRRCRVRRAEVGCLVAAGTQTIARGVTSVRLLVIYQCYEPAI